IAAASSDLRTATFRRSNCTRCLPPPLHSDASNLSAAWGCDNESCRAALENPPAQGLALRRLAGVAGARPDQPSLLVLLEAVRDPADGAADAEERERAARRQLER